MSAQAILKENEQGLLASSYKVKDLREMKIICSLLTVIHQEINDYEQLLTMTRTQYANNLFQNNKEYEDSIKQSLLEYTVKVNIYRNIANKINTLLSQKGD